MSEELRILVVEDNPADADFIRELLSEFTGPVSFRVETLPQLSQGIARLEKKDLDLVLLDLSLPDSSGLPTLHQFRKAAPDIPVVVLTGSDDPELAVNALRDGAQDYLVKGQFDGNLLLRTARYARERQKTETALRENESRLRAIFDCSRDAIGIAIKEKHLFANPAYLKLFGYENTGIAVGTSILNQIAPGHRQQVLLNLERRAAGETAPAFYETRGIKADGTEFEMEVSVSTYALHGEIHTVANIRDISDRKRAEAALEKSHNEFKDLFDNAPIGFHEIDAEGRLVRINKTELAMLGYSAGELLGQFVWKLAADEDFSRRACLAKLAGEPPPPAFERLFRRKDGSVFQVLTNDRMLKQADGKITGIRAAIQDNTDRRQAQAALEESRQMLRSVLDTIPVRVFWKDVHGRFLGANQALARDAGLNTPQEIIGKNDHDMAWKVHANLYIADDQQVITSGDAKLSYEEPMITPTGNQLWVRTSKVPLRDLDGRIVGILGTYEDITAHKQAEAARQESEERLRTLVQAIPDLVWLKDINGVFLYCNAAFERLCGVPENSIIGKTDYDFMEKSVADAFRQHDRAALAAGKPTTNEEWLTFIRDGYRGLFQTIKTPMCGADGTLLGVLGVARDITERNTAEEQIKVQLNELQRWQDVMLGREERVQELKREVNELCRRAGVALRYASETEIQAASKTRESKS